MNIIEIKYLGKYIWDNKLASLIIIYGIIAIILKSLNIIDITIPCLWTTIFGHHCPGCGLTTATIELVHFRPISAFKINPLVYIILPAILYCIISDYIKFRKKLISTSKD